MPLGSKIPQGSSGEFLTHTGALRLRVVGYGNLRMRIFSQDETRMQELQPIVMEESTDKQPTKLCNMIAMRQNWEIYTEEKNEYFEIQRITAFMKPVYTGY